MRSQVETLVPKIIESIGLEIYKRDEISLYSSILYCAIAGVMAFARTDFVNVNIIS